MQKRKQMQTSSNKCKHKQTNAGNNSTNSAVNNGNNAAQSTNINFQAQARNPVNSAYAAPLTAGVDTCMGSSSVGAQGVTFGFSGATTWTDKNCVRLKNSRELNSMGMTTVACELLAIDPEVAEAMRRAHASCQPAAPVTVTMTAPEPAPAPVPVTPVAPNPAPIPVAVKPPHE